MRKNLISWFKIFIKNLTCLWKYIQIFYSKLSGYNDEYIFQILRREYIWYTKWHPINIIINKLFINATDDTWFPMKIYFNIFKNFLLLILLHNNAFFFFIYSSINIVNTNTLKSGFSNVLLWFISSFKSDVAIQVEPYQKTMYIFIKKNNF